MNIYTGLFPFLIVMAAFGKDSGHSAKYKMLVEAESFNKRGDWLVDRQSMEQMGSSCLLAHGIGTTVMEAPMAQLYNLAPDPSRRMNV